MTFVIILNIHLWNYFLLSRAYAREPPCNNFDSTSSDRLSLVCPSSQLLFLSFCRQDNIIRVNLHRPWAHFTFQPSHPSYIFCTPSPSIYTLPSKAPCLCHAIPHRCAPLVDHFHYVAWNIFSVQSPCSSFDIVTTVEVGLVGVYIRRISIYDIIKRPGKGGGS